MSQSKRVPARSEMPVRIVDLSKADERAFVRRCVGCLVLSQDGKILLQQRDENSPRFPGCLATFGGAIDSGETPIQTLVRELKEELGAEVQANEVISLGALTESYTRHTELVYVYFWHDKRGTITGCYEGQAAYYTDSATALKHPKVMDDVVWLLHECQHRGLL